MNARKKVSRSVTANHSKPKGPKLRTLHVVTGQKGIILLATPDGVAMDHTFTSEVRGRGFLRLNLEDGRHFVITLGASPAPRRRRVRRLDGGRRSDGGRRAKAEKPIGG